MYKVLNNHTAPSLRASFIRMRDTQYDYQLRNRETDLVIPRPRSEYLKKSFKYSGAVMWNALSTDAKSSVSLNSFKRLSGFKLFVFSSSFVNVFVSSSMYVVLLVVFLNNLYVSFDASLEDHHYSGDENYVTK